MNAYGDFLLLKVSAKKIVVRRSARLGRPTVATNRQLSVIVLQMSVNQYVLLTLFFEVQHKYNF